MNVNMTPKVSKTTLKYIELEWKYFSLNKFGPKNCTFR